MAAKKTTTKAVKSEKPKTEAKASAIDSVKSGSKVKFHYTGKLEDGSTFDTSQGRAPLEFTAGSGMIIPGLEKGMMGMKIGEKRLVTVEAKDAYGQRRDDMVHEVPKGNLPKDMVLTKGTVLYLKSPDGQPFTAMVHEVKESTLVLDFNHPLAGKKLIFEIEIVEIA